jgi:phage portal protein BeeE
MLNVTTILACARVRAEGLSVPFRVYQETGGGRKIATDHPLHMLISRKPNGWQTSLEFLETVSFHLDLTYNAFVFVNRVGIAREIRELIPIEPGRVRVEQQDRLQPALLRSRQERRRAGVRPGRDLASARPSWNSWVGHGCGRAWRATPSVSRWRSSRAERLAEEQPADVGGLFGQGQPLAGEIRVSVGWMDKHLPGGERAGKPMILDMGAEFTRLLMSSVDQQIIETRKFQIEENCRTMRVWPIMIGHAGDQSPTFASASEFFQAHKTYTLDPMYRRISQSANVNLLGEDDLAPATTPSSSATR